MTACKAPTPQALTLSQEEDLQNLRLSSLRRPPGEQAVQLQLAATVAGLVSLPPGRLLRSSAAGELRQNLLHLLRRLCQGPGAQGPGAQGLAVLQRAGSDRGSRGAAQGLLVSLKPEPSPAVFCVS